MSELAQSSLTRPMRPHRSRPHRSRCRHLRRRRPCLFAPPLLRRVQPRKGALGIWLTVSEVQSWCACSHRLKSPCTTNEFNHGLSSQNTGTSTVCLFFAPISNSGLSRRCASYPETSPTRRPGVAGREQQATRSRYAATRQATRRRCVDTRQVNKLTYAGQGPTTLPIPGTSTQTVA